MLAQTAQKKTFSSKDPFTPDMKALLNSFLDEEKSNPSTLAAVTGYEATAAVDLTADDDSDSGSGAASGATASAREHKPKPRIRSKAKKKVETAGMSHAATWELVEVFKADSVTALEQLTYDNLDGLHGIFGGAGSALPTGGQNRKRKCAEMVLAGMEGKLGPKPE